MKLSKIVIVGGVGDITLNITNVSLSDEYVFRGADGLGPPELDVILTRGKLQGRRAQDREVVIRMGLNPNYGINQTVEELREQVYTLLSGGLTDTVFVNFYEDLTPSAFAEGYVKKIEILPFDEDPIVQITISCLKPLIEAFQKVISQPTNKTQFTINNEGTADTGFELKFTLQSAMSYWSISDSAGKKIRLDFDFQSGDFVYINTNDLEKMITVTRGGLSWSILSGLSVDSDWLELKRGNNIFNTSSPAYNWGSFEYTPKFWGI